MQIEEPTATIDPSTAPIPVFQPYLGPEVQEAAVRALQAGWIGMGSLTARLEDELASYLELSNRYVVATSSCTGALHCAFLQAGVGPGDEVICPSFTYVAGHQAVTATGAEVVFADIDESTCGLDPDSVRAAISPRTKAILVLHFAGIPARSDEIYAIAAEHGLRVVEDAAHALGTRSDGRPIGSFGDLICFSFGPVKIITSLEGGAVVTGDQSDVQPLHELRLVGVNKDTAERYKDQRTWEYDVVRQGFRYHLGSIPAAIGLSQLALIDTFVENRIEYCRGFNEAFRDLDGAIVPDTDFTDCGMFIYFLRVAGGDAQRTALQKHLSDRGIATGIHFPNAHHFTFLRDARRVELPVTELIADQIVTLPLHSFMDDVVRERVIDGVRSFFS
ncbi:MAG: DegT/DnrJ/EryC1/StrS family aminotransferase [Actinobacteria bacterium]|nr:DegT/DnrJ/EryC1/StrS family aminotransferase [Actinomycetota bacterium]